MAYQHPPMKDMRRANVSGNIGKTPLKPKMRTWDVYRADTESRPVCVGPGVAVYSDFEVLRHIGTVEETTAANAIAKARRLYRRKATEHFTVMPRRGK